MDLTVVKNATCTFCGCVCDDIELHAENDRITKAKNACSLGESWFKHHTAERLYPDALVKAQRIRVVGGDEEHDPLAISPGVWEVRRQREYDPWEEQERWVAD